MKLYDAKTAPNPPGRDAARVRRLVLGDAGRGGAAVSLEVVEADRLR
jgi:hypothetical protein